MSTNKTWSNKHQRYITNEKPIQDKIWGENPNHINGFIPRNQQEMNNLRKTQWWTKLNK